MVKLEGLHVVTGAFGYIGRLIAHHLLKQGAQVRHLPIQLAGMTHYS